MKKCELSIEREIQFMIKYQLTADEFFLFKLIFLAQDGQEEYLSMFFTQDQLGKEVRDLLCSLQEKGIINKSYSIPEKGIVFNPNDCTLNKKVLTEYYKHSEDLGMELFEHYPLYTIINGRTFSLRNIGKVFKSFDEFCMTYAKSIKFNPAEHQRILELLDFAKENNLIHNGICDFVLSRQWDTLEIIKDQDFGTFNTMELI